MHKKRHLTFGLFLLLLSTDLLETIVQFCFKKAALAQTIQEPLNVPVFIIGILSTPFLWLGLFTVFTLFVIWSGVISRIDLSVAVPVASFSYITIPLVSVIFFHEVIAPTRWLGIFFIILGVILVSLSSKQAREAAA
ncbi:MAG: EamA family transporter [Candidatus Omnitrophota bacterium]